jgi:FkbH-like protein
MNYFNYPLDTKMLFRKKNKIRRELLKNNHLIQKKIAVLGGSTTNEIVEQLENFLLYYGISAKFYQSDYGQYWQESVFETGELSEFKPDIIYIHTNWRNINKFPKMSDSKGDVEKLLAEEYDHFEIMWEKLKYKFHCPIIQNNFERPNSRLMGNRDIWDYRGKSNFISCLNQKFYQYAQMNENFYINDLEYIAQDYGITEWNDPLYWNMYKCAMAINAIPYVAQSVANIIKSIYGKNKKVMVLDLDNTLWGGVIGDDGVEGIKIGHEQSEGQAYLEFQQYCKRLKDIGVILAVNSKNDMKNALEGLEHPDGILRPEDFVAIKANWNTKDQNISEIAAQLTLGIDSFVFIDDNPVERDIVSSQLPNVAVPDMDKIENFINILDHSGYFEATVLSQEDLKKTEMYHAKVKAAEEKALFANYEEYLESLQMQLYIDNFRDMYIERIAQLTNKSNQFNLTTLRCTEDDIRNMGRQKNYICLCGRLIDKYVDNGLITVVVGEIRGNVLDIRLWLMSCRVLKREVENAMMNVLISEAKKRGISRIVGYYYCTSKNGMVSEFYGNMGYTLLNRDENGHSQWQLELSHYTTKNSHMKVINQFLNEGDRK